MRGLGPGPRAGSAQSRRLSAPPPSPEESSLLPPSSHPPRGRRHPAEDRGPHSLCALKSRFQLGMRRPPNHTGSLAFLKVKHPQCQGLLRKSVTNVMPRDNELNWRRGWKPRPHCPAEPSGLDSLQRRLCCVSRCSSYPGGLFCVFCCYAQILQESGPSARCPHWSIFHIYKCFPRCSIFQKWLRESTISLLHLFVQYLLHCCNFLNTSSDDGERNEWDIVPAFKALIQVRHQVKNRCTRAGTLLEVVEVVVKN